MTPVLPAALFILKIFILTGLFLYVIFTAVLVRQEHLMAAVLEESFEPMIRLLVIGHLVAAIVVFILSCFLL